MLHERWSLRRGMRRRHLQWHRHLHRELFFVLGGSHARQHELGYNQPSCFQWVDHFKRLRGDIGRRGSSMLKLKRIFQAERFI